MPAPSPEPVQPEPRRRQPYHRLRLLVENTGIPGEPPAPPGRWWLARRWLQGVAYQIHSADWLVVGPNALLGAILAGRLVAEGQRVLLQHRPGPDPWPHDLTGAAEIRALLQRLAGLGPEQAADLAAEGAALAPLGADPRQVRVQAAARWLDRIMAGLLDRPARREGGMLLRCDRQVGLHPFLPSSGPEVMLFARESRDLALPAEAPAMQRLADQALTQALQGRARRLLWDFRRMDEQRLFVQKIALAGRVGSMAHPDLVAEGRILALGSSRAVGSDPERMAGQMVEDLIAAAGGDLG